MIDLPPPPLPYPPTGMTPPPLPTPPRFRPTALLAWLVMIGVCVTLPLLRAEKQEAAAAPTTLPVTGTVPAPEPDRVNAQVEMAGRMWVGLMQLFPSMRDEKSRKQLENSVGLPQDTQTEKMAAAIVFEEIGQQKRAETIWADLHDPAAFELRGLYMTQLPDAPPSNLSTDLHHRLGWFARLAEVHAVSDANPQRIAVLGEAKRSAVTIASAFLLFFVALAVGFCMMLTAIILLALGKLRFAPARPVGKGYVYAEAAAIYLGGFVVVSLVIAYLLPGATIVANVGGLCSVVVLATFWPLIRGVRVADVKRDWGVHTGRGVVREMLAGIGGYVAGLPLMLVGLITTALIIQWTGARPSHPIMQGGNAEGGSHLGMALMLYGIASVFAPLTEELLFRGALVSHLRTGMNAFAAAAVSGLIFAAVHPQGWAVVPALMSVGIVLALVRQWRGSLIASITAHAMHNGILVTVMLLATG